MIIFWNVSYTLPTSIIIVASSIKKIPTYSFRPPATHHRTHRLPFSPHSTHSRRHVHLLALSQMLRAHNNIDFQPKSSPNILWSSQNWYGHHLIPYQTKQNRSSEGRSLNLHFQLVPQSPIQPYQILTTYLQFQHLQVRLPANPLLWMTSTNRHPVFGSRNTSKTYSYFTVFPPTKI